MVAALLGLWTLGAWTLDSHGRRPLPAQTTWDAIIVAGCRVHPNGEPSIALARRTRLAVALWRQGKAPRIVMTGGVGNHPPSEAEAAAKLARQLGVPADVLVLEDRSTTTEENARNAAQHTDAKRVLVITDSFHVYRARRVFARYFDHADGLGSVGKPWARSKGAMREVLAVAWYAAANRL